MMKKYILLLFILAASISAILLPAEAVKYVRISVALGNDNSYIDMDSIKNHNEKSNCWVKVIPTGKDTKLYGKNVAYSKQLWEANIKEKRLYITYFVDYDKSDSVVWKYTPPEPIAMDILPNTVGEVVYRTLMNHK